MEKREQFSAGDSAFIEAEIFGDAIYFEKNCLPILIQLYEQWKRLTIAGRNAESAKLKKKIDELKFLFNTDYYSILKRSGAITEDEFAQAASYVMNAQMEERYNRESVEALISGWSAFVGAMAKMLKKLKPEDREELLALTVVSAAPRVATPITRPTADATGVVVRLPMAEEPVDTTNYRNLKF